MNYNKVPRSLAAGNFSYYVKKDYFLIIFPFTAYQNMYR
jgi:hypothetical protein